MNAQKLSAGKMDAQGLTIKDLRIITVTDHAVLRYMERVMGLNVEAVRTLILADGREQMMQMAKTANIPMGNKNYAILRDYIVCTIRPKGRYAPMTLKTGGKARVPRP